MKRPDECESLVEVRREVDRIDRGIVTLISERAEYVKAAAKFKTTAAAVAAPDRVRTMLEERRQWARDHQLNADFVESLFRCVVDYFISEETRQMRLKATRP